MKRTLNKRHSLFSNTRAAKLNEPSQCKFPVFLTKMSMKALNLINLPLPVYKSDKSVKV